MLGIVFILFFVLIFLGVPLAACTALPSILPYVADNTFTGNYQFVLRAVVSALDSTSLIAIPLFMLSGSIMARGGISRRLFDVFAYFIGEVTAGIPCAVVVTCLFYGAISGSGPATVAAVGAMCIPILTKLGYDKIFSTALVATAGGLGVIIPPSIPFIVYGVACGVSVGDLFIAGIVPGILVAFVLMLYAYLYCKRRGEDKEKIRANHQELKKKGCLRVLKEGFWALLTPVIILGGIYSGIVTPTEAACVSIFYAIFVCLAFYKSMKLKELPAFLAGAVKSYAPMCLLLGFGGAFGKILHLLHAPEIISDYLTSTIDSKVLFLLLINVVFLFLGMVGETTSGIIIMGPVILTAAQSFGVSPIHFGVILIINLAIGLVSPPIGVNLFVAAPLVGESPMRIAKAAVPFMLFFLAALLIVTFVPQLSLLFL
ncbi:TRAP transporter large permease [Cuneatibacter sp. NSJ-177]|uniref:TRAP transporter large permease n=1 Tax=Cuneatibacter sp. NSJ-177 TaxID=2931401 RepID=UPI001FD0F3F3|nr:TRAP transporter large permease [Cuneatibacter sp. NSJ-177]